MPPNHSLKPRRFLVIEADGPFQRQLVADLEAAGPYSVTVARTAGEACLILTQQPHDLALIPLANSGALIRALRTVQSDLPLVLLADAAELVVGQELPETAQALLLRSCLETELPLALQQALSQPAPALNATNPRLELLLLPIDSATANQLLLGLAWPGSIRGAVLLENDRLVAQWGRVDSEIVQAIADQLQTGNEVPERGASSIQVQFIELPAAEQATPFVLYTRTAVPEFRPGLLLALIAVPQTTVAELRSQADVVAGQLHDLIVGSFTAGPADTIETAATEVPSVAADGGRKTLAPGETLVPGKIFAASKTFAIVWRALPPLNDLVQHIIGRHVERIAQANGCLLRHKLVRSDLVHLVVTCPPGRNAAWAAHLFKQSLLDTVASQAAKPAATAVPEAHISWARGYYATEADVPLSEAELNLFLEQDRSR